MEATTTLKETVGVKAACSALGAPRTTYYRHVDPKPRPTLDRPRPPLAFVDASPRQIWATLLDDEQQHLCSVSTMYCILGRHLGGTRPQ